MNQNFLQNTLAQMPIVSCEQDVGKQVECLINGNKCVWVWPSENSKLDIDYDIKLPILECQTVVAIFTIVKGTPIDHAKFSLFNSIGFDEKYFYITCQRKSVARFCNPEQFFLIQKLINK